VEVGADQASTSSKEYKSRGRLRKNQEQEQRVLQATAGASVDEEEGLKQQQPSKRRKITPEEVADSPRPKRTRSRPALENVDATLAPEPRRRGRQPKAQPINDEEASEPPPNGCGKPRGAKRGHSPSPNQGGGLRTKRQAARKQPVNTQALLLLQQRLQSWGNDR
jgi:hypothetical protein